MAELKKPYKILNLYTSPERKRFQINPPSAKESTVLRDFEVAAE